MKMLLVNEKKRTGSSVSNTVSNRIYRYLKKILLLSSGVLILSLFILLISEMDDGSRRQVYAVESTDSAGGTGVQTGLNGILSGIADMAEYANSSRMISTKVAKENALAGAVAVDRRVVQRGRIASGTGRAGELGYYAQQTVSENQMSSDEYYTLLQIVEAEATGGDEMSKMMVAGVVLNRVRDERFPDTIYDVVWQPEQFQPTSDGRIYSVTVTDSTIEAVERVLKGEDYSQGALFFFARDSAEANNAVWFDTNLEKLTEYGGHEYFTFSESV